LKTRNLLIFRNVQNAENGKIAPNWNVSGTEIFHFAIRNSGHRVTFVADRSFRTISYASIKGETGGHT